MAFVEKHWEDWYVKGLADFIRVPNLTPMVDPEYLTNGLVEESMVVVDDYVQKLNIKGISRQVIQPEGCPPLVIYVVEGSDDKQKNVMLYGHLDKQPWMTGWEEGLSPTDPVRRGEYMYGRGGADDGYSVFSCMLGIKNGQEQGVPMPRCVMVLESEEESGSPNLIKLLTEAKEIIGVPDFCFCMDSGAFDYNQMWVTSSLRGICILDLTVECAKGGYHSGEVGGIVPETFRIIRALLDRLDDPKTGKVIPELETEILPYALEEAKVMAAKGKEAVCLKYDLHDGVEYVSDNLEELYLNSTWRATLAITGASGLPDVAVAGNVVRSGTSVRCSMRLPPNMDVKKAEAIMTEKLTTDVPHNAKVSIHGGHTGSGFCMETPEPWFDEALKKSGLDFFGKPTGQYGMGCGIPFLAELKKMYPATQITALGLIGPKSNCHAPNECINLDFAKKLTCALAHLIAAVGARQ